MIPFSLSPEMSCVWNKRKKFYFIVVAEFQTCDHLFFSPEMCENKETEICWSWWKRSKNMIFFLFPKISPNRDMFVVVEKVQKCDPFFLFPKTSTNRYMLVVVARGLRRACWVNWWWLGRGCSLLSLDEDDLRKPLYKMWHPKLGGGGV